ncbi:M20 metallopeptidase family protein [Cohnella zeiphila]|uniref:Amidohydrolase n=1 Tax=Cohnella zeiphila TaxID=2761120 RepID=A0A7X0STJ2_9BACL|nr:amidohydrolase [Cohnella zeiphila]MBB6735874.1 amidohydrolase [Cohnella zeiphila]
MTANERTLQSLFGDMVAWRRHLHRHPELSFREEKTSAWIADHLEAWGLDVTRGVAGTGVVAKLTGGRPGRAIALRADIDALPIHDAKSCDYASAVPGVMHACGHDGHTAELLAVARYYSLHREETVGTRLFLFQPAEEVLPGGALGMIGAGAIREADAVYGVHLWSPFPYGTVSTRPGPLMASPDEFEIEIAGRGGHAGLPHQSADALVAGAHLVVALQTIVSRSVDPLESAVVTVGQLQAGTANNVIAERCRLAGTVRSFTPEARALVRDRLEAIARHIAEMHGAKATVRYIEGYPPVVNDEREAERFFRVASAQVGPEAVKRCEPIMAGEDFSYYLREKPGCFFFVGAGREDGTSAPHHHPLFDIDERAMLTAARLLVAVADDAAADPEAG